MQEIIGIVTFDKDSFEMIKNLQKNNDLSIRILTINNFSNIKTEVSKDYKTLINYKIEENTKVIEYIYKNLTGIDKIFCITNYSDYNNAIAYELNKALKEINPNVQILTINLKEVNHLNLIEAINNSNPLSKEDYKYFMVKKVIDRVSGLLFSKIFSKFMNKKIVGSNSTTNLFVILYKNRFKNKNKKIRITEIKEMGEEIYLIKNMRKSDIISNVLKLYPSIEINEILNKINKYYYGIKNKNKINQYLSFEFSDERKEELKKIYQKYEIKFKDREDISEDEMFAINYEKIPRGTDYEKFIYQVILIKTFLYFMDLKVNKEILIYNDNSKFKYRSVDLPEDFLEYLKNNFNIEKWQIDLIINENLKIKYISYFKDSFNILKILNDIKLLKYININENNIEYYINKLNQNGLIKKINNDIIFTPKAKKLYETLEEENLLKLFSNEKNKELYEKIYTEMKKSDELYNMVNDYLKEVSPLTNILNMTTQNQIKKLKSLNNVPEEAFKDKNLANKIISENYQDKEPTKKQINYAEKIAENIETKLPEECYKSAKSINQWIFDNKLKQVRKPSESMILLAKKLSKEYKLKLPKEILKDYNKTQEFISKLI